MKFIFGKSALPAKVVELLLWMGQYQKTDVAGILQLDVVATDFYRDTAYPTYLVYNPHDRDTSFTLQNSSGKNADFYNTVTKSFVGKNAGKNNVIQIEAKEAMVIVLVPAGTKTREENGRLLAGNVVIDYQYPAKSKS